MSISPKSGFHTLLTTEFRITHDRENCTLHQLVLLPSRIFVDPYELELRGDIFQMSSVTELELPVTVMEETLSTILLNISRPINITAVKVQLPLHIRYGVPDGAAQTKIPAPLLFWSCPTRGQLKYTDASKYRFTAYRTEKDWSENTSIVPFTISKYSYPSCTTSPAQSGYKYGQSSRQNGTPRYRPNGDHYGCPARILAYRTHSISNF